VLQLARRYHRAIRAASKRTPSGGNGQPGKLRAEKTRGSSNKQLLESSGSRACESPGSPALTALGFTARFRIAVDGGVGVTVFSRDYGYLGLMTLRFDNREYPRTRSFRILEPRALSAQVSSHSRTRVLHRALHTRYTRISSVFIHATGRRESVSGDFVERDFMRDRRAEIVTSQRGAFYRGLA